MRILVSEADHGHFTVPAVLGGEIILGNRRIKAALWPSWSAKAAAEALFLLAKRLNLTQAEISAKIGIPQRTLTVGSPATRA